MNRIKLLDESTSNRIAAGEVVERPASVIKELCENALDAGATALSVDIEAGGLKYIGVTDNGSGIHPDDVAVSFQRHATSKIRSGDSLSAIETLGFRGEALSSIASVSRLCMKTRIPGREMGRIIELQGGKVVLEDDCGCPEGTSIDVHDIFYNTPARLKFVKAPGSEAASASDVMLRLILANPDISIKFTNNGKVIYHSPGTGLLDGIRAVYGRDVAANLIEVRHSSGGAEISGYVGKPDISRKTRAGQTFIINSRYVKSATLGAAVADGYDQKLMIGRFPFFVLHIDLPPSIVDVNVHPQKLEIRISNEQALCDILCRAVNDAVIQRSDIRHMDVGSGSTALPEQASQDYTIDEQQEIVDDYRRTSIENSLEDIKTPTIRIGTRNDNSGMQLSERGGLLTELDGNNIPIHDLSIKSTEAHGQAMVEKDAQQADMAIRDHAVLIGQAFETYAIVQSGDRLFYIDQHAAHERLNYERYMQQARSAAVAAQQLLTPTIVKLTYEEKQCYLNNREYFERLGFDIDDFGTTDIAVRAIPMILGEPALLKFLKDALDSLAQSKPTDAPGLIEDKIIMSACKHSIKAGDKLSRQELDTLIEQLMENEKLTCPHGRPVAIYITKHDLEKGFKRLV